MSAVALSSTTTANNSTSSNFPNYSNNPPKRRTGTFRVVTEDCSQFTLDGEFDDDFYHVLAENGRYVEVSNPVRKERLIDRPSSSDRIYKKLNKETSRTSSVPYHGREISRLTDEVEIDGDSVSDELDLLPPLPPYSTQKFPKLKINMPNWLMCCNSRIPMKCTIM